MVILDQSIRLHQWSLNSPPNSFETVLELPLLLIT